MSWKVTTEPASEPLTLTEVKNYLKVDFSDDDDLLNMLITAARQWVEKHCNIGLLPQTITEVFDRWPTARSWELSVSPLRAVSAISYKDSAGNVQTWASGNYIVDSYTQPARVQSGYSVTFPTLYDEINSVSAVYTTGWDDADDLPAPIKQAMLLTIADAYENRENYIKKMPTAAEYILQSAGYRIWQFR